MPKRREFDRLKGIAVVGGDLWVILDYRGPTRWSNGRRRRPVIPEPAVPGTTAVRGIGSTDIEANGPMSG